MLDARGKFKLRREDEDCHTAIEKYLVKKLGNTGRKIHTARSRNDQVLTALRLYYRDELESVARLIDGFSGSLSGFRKKYGSICMPGYTHMRKAMPSTAGLWAGSFIESMDDNRRLLVFISRHTDQSPLGTGAGYGLPVKVDRKHTARLLGFGRTQQNPVYVQNSRGKFEASILHALGQVVYDLNKIASDIILFSMPEFGYFVIPEELCTGSSIMPHKRNPDALELVRAKYQQLVSQEFRVKGIIGNLPSGYNRDLQLTKEPVMSAFDTTKACLNVMALVMRGLRVDRKKCESAMTRELYSAERVHRLVRKKIPFRDAYRKVSEKF